MANKSVTSQSEQVEVNVVGSSIFGRYPKISAEKTYNMFISDNWLINFPGFQRFDDLLKSGKGRGFFHSVRGNLAVAVVNDSVFKIDDNFNVVFIGKINTTSGAVFMAENLFFQIAIVDGLNIWIYAYKLGNSLTKYVTDSNTAGMVPTYVSYQNNMFLVGNNNTSASAANWFTFVNDTPTTITWFTTQQMTAKPDFPIAIKPLPSQSQNVLVMGKTVCEIQANIGAPLNYKVIQSVNIDYGVLSVSTIASSDEYIAWLGVNESNAPVIMVCTTGGQAYPLSTDGIDFVLGNLKHPETSTAMFYREAGHLFYHLTFYDPDDNLTLVYDFDTKMFFHLSDHELNYHPAQSMVYFQNNLYFLSLNNASVYQFNTNFNTYDENTPEPDIYNPDLNFEVPRIRICKSVRRKDTSRSRANNFTLNIDQGNDPNYVELQNSDFANSFLIAEDGDFFISEDGDFFVTEDSSGGGTMSITGTYTPCVDLSISKDGGMTFSNYVRRNLQPLGHRQNILKWGTMGQSNDLIVKLHFWGMSAFVVNDAILEMY